MRLMNSDQCESSLIAGECYLNIRIWGWNGGKFITILGSLGKGSYRVRSAIKLDGI